MVQEFDIKVRDKKGDENGVVDHPSRIKIEHEVPINDNLPEEHIYIIKARIKNLNVKKNIKNQIVVFMSIDTSHGVARRSSR